MAGPGLVTNLAASTHRTAHNTVHSYVNMFDTTTLTTRSDGDVLTWDSSSTSAKWEAPTGGGSGSDLDLGVVQIASFAGANDRAKFAAALTYMAAETRKRPLMFPATDFAAGLGLVGPFAAFSGLRLWGPYGSEGTKNLELSSGNLVNHRVNVWSGSGASSLFTVTGTVNDFDIMNVAFQGLSTSQLVHSAAGSNCYPAQFHSITLYGFMHGFGNPTSKFLGTQCQWTGHWTVLGYHNTQFTIGGADMNFNWYLNSNSPPSVDGNGLPIVVFSDLQKTDVHYPYLTNENDWVGLRVIGDSDDIHIHKGVFEGRSQTNLATRPTIDIQGGTVHLDSCRFGQVSDANPTDAPGVIKQSGGHLILSDAVYHRGSAVAANFPLLYQTAGTADVRRPIAYEAGEQIRVRWSTGSTTAVALPSNLINGAAP